MGKKILVIAGGGTGGHIYPGLSLATKLKELDTSYEVHFVGASGGLEESIVPKSGYPLHLLKVGRLHSSVGLWRRLKTLLGLPLCFLQALSLCLRLKPVAVIGIGGFASGPIVFVASLLGKFTAILEPNAYPGMANRYLAKWVSRCFIVFEETKKFFPAQKVQVVGLPIRFPKHTREQYFDGSRPLRVLVFGGSQGAQAINKFFAHWWRDHSLHNDKIEVIHQVGIKNLAQWNEFYEENPKGRIQVKDYLHDMPEKIKWADLCICRAGIGTVVELAMTQTPALFIPLPTAADNHQQKNAEVLVKREGGWMVHQDKVSPDFLDEFFENILNDPKELQRRSRRLDEIDFSNSAQTILSHVLGDQL